MHFEGADEPSAMARRSLIKVKNIVTYGKLGFQLI